MLIMDEILAACQQLPDFYSSPKTIVQQHFEKSKFLVISSTEFRKERAFVHLLLQDAATISGEIDDWRIVRIWIVLLGWIIDQAGPKDIDVDRLQDQDETTFMASDASEEFLELLMACMVHCEQKMSDAYSDASFERDVRRVLWAQSNYIYRSAGPEQLLLRKRLAYRLGAASTRRNNFVVRMICDSFDSAEQSSRKTKDASTSLTVLSSATALLLAGTSMTMESDVLVDAMSQRLAACLRELQALCSTCKRDLKAKRGLQVQLESILDHYAPLLRLNQLLMADIICAMGIYIGEDDRQLWNSLVVFMVVSARSPC